MATVNYDLLYKAGAALAIPDNKHAVKPFIEMVKLGKKYFDDAKIKMDTLTADAPTIDISKISPENTPMIVDWLRKQKFIIGDAARDMSLYGSRSERGIIATESYNNATQQIFNLNND